MAQKTRLRYADEQMDLMNYHHALEMYAKAYEKKPVYGTAKKVAMAHEKLKDYDQAYNWWKNVLAFDESNQEDQIQLLRTAEITGNLAEAKALLQAKGVASEGLEVSTWDESRASRKLKVENLKELNSSESDFFLVEDKQGNRFFVSDRGESYSKKMPGIRIDGRNKFFSPEFSSQTERQYFSVFKQDQKGIISRVFSQVPGTLGFSDPSFDTKDSLMFYSVTRSFTKVKKNRNITVQPEIYYSRISPNGNLEGFYPFPYNDSINYAVMHPFVDEEFRRLYFSSDMPGGFGGYDLYYSEYDENMSFGNPINLGSIVNTKGDENYPYRNGKKFFFTSTGHKGLGGMDIFEANFTPFLINSVVNLGSPINSRVDDFAFREDRNRTLYFSSNRKGGLGLDDIYMAKEMHKHFLARVVDCDGNLIMTDYSANLKIKPQAITIPSFRNSKGELLAQLESESDFALHISKPGYFSVKDESISTKGFSGDTLKRSYVLKPIPYQLPLYLDIVYYDLDKFVIRKDAMPVLDKLSELMNRFSFLDLLVASHTDSRASDEYNIRLSNNRAKAITEYLGTKGINANRVRLEWFGEGKLVNDCGNDKPCPEPKHQLNRRSELVLEAFPDPTIQYEIPEELKGMDFCDPEKIFEEIQEEIKNLPSIYFDFDKDMLRSIQQKDLERTASMLKRMPNLMLQIEGHTDQSGTEHYNNQMLSVRRAKSVIDYLNTRGISQYQIKSAWFGESSPQ